MNRTLNRDNKNDRRQEKIQTFVVVVGSINSLKNRKRRSKIFI